MFSKSKQKCLITQRKENNVDFYYRWYIDAPHIILYGKPSAEYAKQQSEEESQRLMKQRTNLGSEKLEDLQKKLDEATAKNNVEVPKELLEGFKVPPISSIKFIDVVTARNNDKDM